MGNFYPICQYVQTTPENSPWKWGHEQKEAFRKAKELLTSSSVLIHYDLTKPLVLACDASPYGLGAILLSHQLGADEQPIAFASCSLAPAEKNYSQIDKGTLATVGYKINFHQLCELFEKDREHFAKVHMHLTSPHILNLMHKWVALSFIT